MQRQTIITCRGQEGVPTILVIFGTTIGTPICRQNPHFPLLRAGTTAVDYIESKAWTGGTVDPLTRKHVHV